MVSREAESATDGAAAPSAKPRITEGLRVVVTRARWKAAACRLALDKRALAKRESEDPEATEQIAARERSLRTRLQGLVDTSAWMLDLPFGTRVSESDAFDVGDEQVERMRHVSDCYETVALGAETAMDLDESGAFRNGPVPAYLYLMAEAQSALLHSLHDAPTRNDSDQRDVFLWLKDQTTRCRIYVDRHMRLDDPADITASADLSDRIKRSAREILDARKTRRERGQILNKIRYHVRKLIDGGPLRVAEVDSLGAAIERWTAAGNTLGDRNLVELLQSLRDRAKDRVDAETPEDDAPGAAPPSDGSAEEASTPEVDTASAEAQRRLDALLANLPQTRSAEPRAQGAPGGAGRGRSPLEDTGATGSDAPADEPSSAVDLPAGERSLQDRPSATAVDEAERSAQLLEEVRGLLEKRRVVMFLPDPSAVNTETLCAELGAASIRVAGIDVDGDLAKRWTELQASLDAEDTDLMLLGVRLAADEYQRFKDACLAQKKPFVRLPGALAASAIAHQVTRQVGWRLRALRDQDTRVS